ncbi:uncharacterized protein SETTUDRAFT_20797 [Exserohilum turcica Et28A]|uniref:Cytochrome b561 domain-containing protein n=1 Tax=Exserohilum turcicum (strain 28A) TaxID=671987 RepID=R0K6W2_EXST2|nr:uncharacterized protein SETTUDRAFT_20797 [Exserohilum turcica Et28A]EOA85284.1 hypothetical protein SETTUDRAFT_20797 [Exserohilum turcica Et28A]
MACVEAPASPILIPVILLAIQLNLQPEGNLTFALSAVNDTGDTFIHLSGPTAYQWIAIGTGSRMRGSVMLIVYKNETGGITLSPRLAPGEIQPSYSSTIDCKLLAGGISQQPSQSTTSSSTSASSIFSADVHCTNLRSLGRDSGKISFTDSNQPFIYALGPDSAPLTSNSVSANIQQHDSYGTFSLDMVIATSASSKSTGGQEVGVPTGSALTSSQGTSGGRGGGDGEGLDNTHAAFMLAAFVILFPLGAVLLRYVKNGVKVHAAVQSIALVCTVMGGAIGIKLSLRSPANASFDDPHQVLGLIIFVLVFVQWGLGLVHHLRFRRYMQPTVLGKIHRIVGPVVLLIGFVNGFLGFRMTHDEHKIKWLGGVVGVVALATTGLLVWKQVQKRSVKQDPALEMMRK